MPGFRLAGGSSITGKADPSGVIGGSRDLKRVHRWEIGKIVGQDIDDAATFAASVTAPGISFEEEKGPGSSIDYKVAKKPIFKDVTIRLYDVDGLHMRLEQLVQSVWTADGGLQPAGAYKGRTEITLIGNCETTRHVKYTLVNSWIKEFTHSDLTYDSSEFKLLTLVISYDYYRVHGINNQGAREPYVPTPRELGFHRGTGVVATATAPDNPFRPGFGS